MFQGYVGKLLETAGLLSPVEDGIQDIGPTGPPFHGPRQKPEYLMARSQLEQGPLVRSHSIFDGYLQKNDDRYLSFVRWVRLESLSF